MLTPKDIRLLAEAAAKEVINRMTPPDTILTTEKTAEYLGTTPGAIVKRVERGQLPYHKRHGLLYFSKNEIDAYLLGDDRTP